MKVNKLFHSSPGYQTSQRSCRSGQRALENVERLLCMTGVHNAELLLTRMLILRVTSFAALLCRTVESTRVKTPAFS